MTALILLIATVLGVLLQKNANASPITLEALNLEDKITVSGLSSGAYMAVQMHVSHSKSINGSAIFAGGPFYCAESNVELAQYKYYINEAKLNNDMLNIIGIFVFYHIFKYFLDIFIEMYLKPCKKIFVTAGVPFGLYLGLHILNNIK